MIVDLTQTSTELQITEMKALETTDSAAKMYIGYVNAVIEALVNALCFKGH